MTVFRSILLALIFVMMTSSFAGPAFAGDAAPPSDEMKDSPKPAEAFVDRDGDGISDGLEHRFRKRSGRHRGTDKKQLKQKRNQNKGGTGNGARIR